MKIQRNNLVKKSEVCGIKNKVTTVCACIYKSSLVYVIGGSVVLFGKNRVLKLAVVNKIVRAQRVQFGNQRPISEPLFFPNSTTDPPITS